MAKAKKPSSSTGTPSGSSPRHRFTYWMTRDSDPNTGAPIPWVRVWLARPTREVNGAGARWVGPKADDYYCDWSLDDATFHARTYPDDDRQCVVVGGHSVRGPNDTVDRRPA